MLFGDQLLVVLARDVLRTHPGATIIADVKASQVLFDEIAEAGGVPLMWKTGHSLIKAKMAETGCPARRRDVGPHRSSPTAGTASTTRCMPACGCSASWRAWTASCRRCARRCRTWSTRRNCVSTADEARKFKVIEEVAARLKSEGARVSDIDGVRVRTEDGWWLLRASNTQAVLVARAEASTTEGLERLKAALVAQLEGSGIAAPDFSGAQAGH